MAYATKYYFIAPGLREAEYRCQLQKDGYSSGASEIDRNMESLEFAAGKGDLEYYEALMPSRVEISIRDQSIVREIYGGRDRLWRANIQRRPTSSDPWELWFRGFILGDMGRFDPGRYRGAADLEAVDGLELLKNITRPQDGSTLSHQVWELIDDALAAINSGLDYNINFPWFYRLNETADSELTASDTKLQTLYVEQASHQKDREKPPGEGDLRSHYDVLRTVLKTLNLRLVQGGGEWWIRQRHQGRYGATPTHNYSIGSRTPNNTTSEDFVVDLDASSARIEKLPSNWHRNLGRFSVVHDFGPYNGGGLPEGGLETVTTWSLNSATTPGGAYRYDAQHKSHDNFGPSQDKTQNNAKLVVIFSDWSGADSTFNPCLVSDPFSFPSSGGSNEVFRLSFMHACYLRRDDYVQALRVEHGGYYLTNFQISFPRDVTKGEDVRIPCSEVKAPIPADTTLLIHSKGNDDLDLLKYTISITLTERAEVGQTYLQADLPSNLNRTDFYQDDPIVRPFTWSTTATNALIHYQFFRDEWAKQNLVAVMQTAKGDGQETVSGDEMTIKFGYADRDANADDRRYKPYLMAIDEVKAKLTVGGAEAIQEEFDVLTTEQQSAADESTSYIGDGPSADSQASFFYYNTDTKNRQESLTHWDTASFSVNLNDGLRLAHLRGREYVRELRTKHRGMRLKVHLTDPSHVFLPHNLLYWDGQLWAIEDYSHVPDGGYIVVKVLPVLDEGTAGLSYQSRLTVGDQSTSGSVSGGTSGGAGGSPATPPEAGQYRPGAIALDMVVFSHLTRHDWDLQSLLILADTAPTSGHDFEIVLDGTTVKTVTLPSGTSQKAFPVSGAWSAGTILRVYSRSSDDSTAGVSCSFDIL